MPTGEAGSYAASKHAVVGLSKVLRVETREHGVRVSALCPRVIRTSIPTAGKYGRTNLAPEAADTMMKLWEQLRPMDPRAFARRALRQVERNVPIIVVPSWWRMLWWVERLSPRLSLWL